MQSRAPYLMGLLWVKKKKQKTCPDKKKFKMDFIFAQTVCWAC